MISKKILYSEQLLQLVLALSLLQVDPVNYLEWGVSRIHSNDQGSPWQLEIVNTPFSDYPYMNRKNYVPLIEDLARYDHMRSHDVQAYLLNLSDDPPPLITTMLNMNSINNNNNNDNNISNASDNATSSTADYSRSSNSNSSSSSNILEDSASSSLNLVNLIQDRFQEHDNIEDVFLQSEVFSPSSESIIEQNLADLNDYDDHRQFLAVPTKSELSDQWFEFNGLHENTTESNERNDNNRIDMRELRMNGTTPPTTFTSSAIIDWNDYLPLLNDSSNNSNKNLEKKEDNESVGKNELTEKEDKSDDVGEENNEPVITSNVELTVEEMDLIEVLWKQDVDLGYTLPSLPNPPKESTAEDDIENIEKLKALYDLKADKQPNEKNNKNVSLNPWAGLSYTIDTETGEPIIQSSRNSGNDELDNLLFDDTLLAGINDDKKKEDSDSSSQKEDTVKEDSGEVSDDLEAVLENNLKLNLESGKEDEFDFDLNSPLSILLDETDDLDLLSDMMIQPSTTHFQHPRQPNQNYAHCVNSYRQNGYQGRVPLSRTVSMEQRWQDLANLLSFPPAMGMEMSSHAAHYSPHYPYQASGPMTTQHGHHAQFGHHHPHPHSHPAVLHNASLAEIASQPTTSHHLQPYSSNLGSAVATSMHLTNSTSETDAGNSAYKMEHDLMYYSQANTAELNHTSDGILNIFNDEDLQLMDMAVNEGMYTMRMLDQNSNNTNNATALGPNPHLNNALLGTHMQTNLSSGIGSSTSSTTQQHTSGDRLDASSDSAVSSMGSERVASLSDGEWNEGGSDSAQEYHSKFVGPYDYRFNNSRMLDANRQPVAQKKHQMYGKRFAHESAPVLPPPTLHHPSVGPSIPNVPLKYEPYDGYNSSIDVAGQSSSSGASSVIKPPPSLMDSEMKYSYTLDFPHQRHKSGNGNGISTHELINHNHTYTMPPHHGTQLLSNGNGANPRPQTRDKKLKKSEDEHMTRDEKRARALQIPITVADIINLPMDEFNERLSKYDLSENQLSLIRDIRRRGKNKVAAQNCRKRKLDQIISLADEVKDMKMRKERFIREREMLLTERRRIKDKFAALYRHVFTNLRDHDGNPYSTNQYSLQQSADGNVVLVPRSSQNSTETGTASSRNNGQHSNSQGSNNNAQNFK